MSRHLSILITNQRLDNLAGTETYVYSLAKELKQRGHRVYCYSPEIGRIAKELMVAGIPTVNALRYLDVEFDVIHGHHNVPTTQAYTLLKKPVVFVKHGTIPDAETIPDIPIKKLYVISDEIKEQHPEAEVLYNAIDTERFRPREPQGNLGVLVLDNRGTRIEGDAIYVGGENYEWKVEKYINDAQVVVTTGRGVLEAMACNTPVVVYGRHGCDGLVTTTNYRTLRKYNFSGRKYSDRDVNKEIRSAKKQKSQMRSLILQHHDIRDMADKLIKTYYEVI